jgi:hypothetical protein
MKILSTKAHGILDYLMGALMVASPRIFHLGRSGAETWLPILLGAGMILYSLFTKYEFGVSRSINMKSHLKLDIISGLFLAISPWLFDFNDFAYRPHLLLGLALVVVALVTESSPRRSPRRSQRRSEIFSNGAHRHAH